MDLGLRIVWGSGQPRAWQGYIRLEGDLSADGGQIVESAGVPEAAGNRPLPGLSATGAPPIAGRFSDVRLLGLEADEAGSIEWDAAEVRIRQPDARAYDGLDLRVVASRNARLVVELRSSGPVPVVRRIERPLVELIDGFHQESLDEQQNRLLIRRQPGDKLRVRMDHEALVFAPGERLTLEVLPHELGEAAPATRLRLRLREKATGHEAWSSQRELPPAGSASWLGPFAIDMPAREGVYDLSLELTQRRLTAPFVRPRTLLERRVQLVVVGHEPPRDPPLAWKQIAEIDAASSPSWWARMTRISNLLPGFTQGPLNNEKTRLDERNGQQVVELGVGGWQAYPLPVDARDRPHLLELEVSADEPLSLGVSVIEPDAAGKVLPIGLDSGVVVEQPDSEGSEPRVHRLVFWPRTQAPLLLLVNRHPNRPARFGKIRLLAGPQRLPQAEPLMELDGTPPGDSRRRRQLIAYFDKPLIPENFGGSDALDELSGQSLHDWSTFYQGGQRLTEYLRYVGYQSAVVSVACEGSALYPSRLLEPTPKYDTGVFFVTGQDPLRKDVLELLFRQFDREGLQLVPAIQFASRLPDLERLRGGSAEVATGLELVDEQGLTWVERYGTRSGQAPFYNPLDPRVQEVMRRVVSELVDRYGHHESFGGVALQLGPETFAQLPGPLWGLDDRTIGRFEREMNVDVPGQGPGRFARRAEFLRGTGRPLWLRWRAEQLHGLHQQILRDLERRRPDSRLILAGGDLFSSVHTQQPLLPTMTGSPDLAALLLGFGLDVGQYRNNSRLVFPRPWRLAPRTELPAQAINLQVSQASQLDSLFREFAVSGSLLYHEAQPLRLPTFDERSPFGAENTYTWLVTHFSPAGDEARRRFVRALAQLDSQLILDGGWMLPLGQEAETAQLLAAYRQLPAEPFETVRIVPDAPGPIEADAADGTQPLVIRRLAKDGVTWLYVLNTGAWPVTAELVFRAPPDARPQLLARHADSRFERRGDESIWRLTLRPYDLGAALIAAPDVPVLGCQVRSHPRAADQLRSRLQQLRERVKAVTQPRPLSPLANAGFELNAGDQPLPGWIHATGPGLQITADATQRMSGGRSMRVTRTQSDGPDAWIRSEPFPVPETGRLRVSVWLRTSDERKQPPLRLAVEGRLAGETYYRYANVGAENPHAPLRGRWAEYQFVVDNLPLTELSDLRVGFDLMGPGEVWIDDVRMFDLWLDKTERDEMLKNIALADLHLDEGKLADCQQFLESYWPRFLHYHVQLPTPSVAILPNPARTDADAVRPEMARQEMGRTADPQSEDAVKDAGTPTLLDRFRQLVPRGVLPF